MTQKQSPQEGTTDGSSESMTGRLTLLSVFCFLKTCFSFKCFLQSLTTRKMSQSTLTPSGSSTTTGAQSSRSASKSQWNFLVRWALNFSALFRRLPSTPGPDANWKKSCKSPDSALVSLLCLFPGFTTVLKVHSHHSKALAEAATRCFYLQRSGEEVVLRDNIYEEVGWNFSKLVVKHRDESQEQLFTLLHWFLRPAQQTEEALPVFKAFIHVSKQETHKGKL